jgi:hypothetical protein
MKKVYLVISIAMANLAGMAQINVFPGNNVAIGAGITSSLSNLSINTTGMASATVSITPATATIDRSLYITNNTNFGGTYNGVLSIADGTGAVVRGVWGYACSSKVLTGGQSFGTMGTAGNCSGGYNYGIWGNLLGSKAGAAVYGLVGVQPQYQPDAQYAGYFIGDVKITGNLWSNSVTITGSDQRIKKNIAILDSADKIFKLQPKKYMLKTRSELIASGMITIPKSDTAKTGATVDDNIIPDVAKKQHYGFLAQDLQQVYPDLVYTSGDGSLGVDYQGLIPIIVAQLQQLKAQLDAKDARIVALELAVAKLKAKN